MTGVGRPPWRLLALTVLIVTLSTQPVFLLGAGFLQIGDDLGFGPAGLGALTALFFLTASASSAPLGRLVQRVGWRAAIRFNAVVSGVLLVAIAVAARHVVTLALLLVAGGVVYGLANPAANQVLADHVDPRRRALFFGLKHAGIPSSTLLAGLAVPLVIVGAGWRVAYGLAALLALAVLALAAGQPARPDRRPPPEDPRRRVARLSTARLVLLSGAAALATWAAVALSTYLVAAAVDGGFSESAAGLLLFAGSAASIAGRIAAGAVTDRMGGRGFGAMAVLTGAGAVVFLALPAAGGTAFAVLVPVAFATGWGWPGLMTYLVVNANTTTTAASSSITQAGIFVGAGVGPLVLGWLVDSVSFDAMWLVVSAALALAATGVAAVGTTAAR